MQEVYRPNVLRREFREAEEDRRKVKPTAKPVRGRQQMRGGLRYDYLIDGTTYESREAAAAALGVSPRTISRWCNGYTTAGGEVVVPAAGCYKLVKS